MALSQEEMADMYQMVREMYHHLGLDAIRPTSAAQFKQDVAKNVIKWKEKQAKKAS